MNISDRVFTAVMAAAAIFITLTVFDMIKKNRLTVNMYDCQGAPADGRR